MSKASEEPEFIVAPTEPAPIKALASVISMHPERMGVDVCWFVPPNHKTGDAGRWWGVQRKELKDFVASVQDGRLQRELAQMQQLPMPMVLIEGKVGFDLNGNLQLSGYGQQFTRSQFRGMLWSVRSEGVHVDFTSTASDTAEYIRMLARWSLKKKHTALLARPGPVSQWGKVDDEAFAAHVMQGFEGIGYDRALAIVRHFGGLPLRLSVSERELLAVPGVGKGLVAKLVTALGGEQ